MTIKMRVNLKIKMKRLPNLAIKSIAVLAVLSLIGRGIYWAYQEVTELKSQPKNEPKVILQGSNDGKNWVTIDSTSFKVK